MKTILCEDLKLITPNFSSGNFSCVDIVEYDGNKYCFKIFIPGYYDNNIINNIGSLTEIDFDKEYLTPQYMVLRKGRIIGYLSLYNKNNLSFDDLNLNYENKIIILKDIKEKIQKLHKEYKLIHGDLNLNNMLSDKNFKTSILDFDSSLFFGQEPIDTTSFSKLSIEYLKKFKYDFRADIFRFNYTTLKLLYDIRNDNSMSSLIYLNLIDGNNKVKKLSKELLLEPENTNNNYSGEYIIDYI